MQIKILHCADLHLDSKMESNLPKEKARERKNELLSTFGRMIEYADAEEIGDVIIAGDMFDTRKVSQTAVNYVADRIKAYSHINFYYLKGNHDADGFIEALSEIPSNLKLFDKERFVSYETGDGEVCITGLELGDGNAAQMFRGLILDRDKFNILVLHGQDSQYESSDRKDKAEIISLNSLKGKGIDYLALGHIHTRREGQLDERGSYCYPGCLEGRGFDECGPHGFTVLRIDTAAKTYELREVPFALRKLEEVRVDISDAMSTSQVISAVNEQLTYLGIPDRDLVKVVLTGQTDIDSEMDTSLVSKSFEDRYYFFKIKDETTYRVDYSLYSLDKSLKGEFVRCVSERADISEEDKAAVIRYGIGLLSGLKEVE